MSQNRVDAALRLGQGLGLLAIAAAIAGNDNEALYNVLEAYIDAPNYVTDPVVFAVDDVLPAPVGSDPETDPTKMNGSEVARFRANTLLGVRDQVRGAVAGALDVNPNVVVASGAQATQNSAGTRSLSPVQGSSATKTGNSEVANKTDNPRPVRTVAKSINDQVKASADRLDRTVKKLAGGEQKKSGSDSNDKG